MEKRAFNRIMYGIKGLFKPNQLKTAWTQTVLVQILHTSKHYGIRIQRELEIHCKVSLKLYSEIFQMLPSSTHRPLSFCFPTLLWVCEGFISSDDLHPKGFNISWMAYAKILRVRVALDWLSRQYWTNKAWIQEISKPPIQMHSSLSSSWANLANVREMRTPERISGVVKTPGTKQK